MVDIARDYGLDGRGSIPSRSKLFFSTPQRPDRLWGPDNFLFNVYSGVFPRQQSDPVSEADHHIHLALRSWMVKLYLHSPIHHHAVVFLLIKHKENFTFNLEIYIAILKLQDVQPHRVYIFTKYWGILHSYVDYCPRTTS
jgi:hypothetical protein